jgi:hypothetical protein
VSFDETDHSPVERADGGSDCGDGITFRLAVEAVSGASWVHLFGEWVGGGGGGGGGCVNGGVSCQVFSTFSLLFSLQYTCDGSETSSICFDFAYPIGKSYLVMVDSVSEMYERRKLCRERKTERGRVMIDGSVMNGRKRKIMMTNGHQ